MLDDSLIDACMDLLPNTFTVTLKHSRGGTVGSFTARREETTAEVKEFAEIAAGVQTITWFFPAGQTGFKFPREKWTVTDPAGAVWVVVTDDVTHQQRGAAVVCVRYKTPGA
jgi:hypothetical protein